MKKELAFSIIILIVCSTLFHAKAQGISMAHPELESTPSTSMSSVESEIRLTTNPKEEEYSWPMFRHDSQHTGYTESPAPNTNRTIWKKKIIEWGRVCSSPTVVDGKVFVIGNENDNPNFFLYCLTVNTGGLIWKYEIGEPTSYFYWWSYPCPAVTDNKVIIGSVDGVIYCINKDNGDLIWKYKTDAPIVSSPTIYNGKVFISSSEIVQEEYFTYLYCLDIENGKVIWKYGSHNIGWIFASVILEGNVFFKTVEYDNGKEYSTLFCLDEKTGTLNWKSHLSEYCRIISHAFTPAVSHGKIFVGNIENYDNLSKTVYSAVYCIDTNDGSLIWKYPVSDELSSPAIAHDRIYICGDRSFSVYCLDINGFILWETALEPFSPYERILFSPTIADGKVFIGGYKGLYCLNGSTGHIIWKYKVESVLYSPSVAYGKVFVCTIWDYLYVFGTDESWRVGVKVGDWMLYNSSFTWSSNDPSKQKPQYGDMENIEWVNATIQSISDAKVSIKSTIHFKNGTNLYSTIQGDVRTGDWIFPLPIAAGLSKGDRIWDTENAPILNGTVFRTYAGVNREVNYLCYEQFIQEVNYTGYSKFYIYWDKVTGICCEATAESTLSGQYTTTARYSFKMIDTNVFAKLPLSEWTLLVYLDGDNDLEEEALRNINDMEEVGSTSDVNVIALIDRHPSYDSSDGNWTTTRLYKIEKDLSGDKSKINSKLLADWGEQDMGSDQVLTRFILEVKEKYPAQHYCLVLMGHGGGWKGVCEDETDHNDLLNMTELKKSLANAGITIDVLAFEACFMSMIEVAYQIKDYCKTMVASENVMVYFPGPGILRFEYFPFDTILNNLTAKPNIEDRELAIIFVEKFKAEHPVDPWATLSAIDLSKIDDLSSSVDGLAQQLISKIDTYKLQIRDARNAVKEYYDREEEFPFKKIDWDYIDLQDFAELIKQKINYEDVKNKADNVIRDIKMAVIDEWHYVTQTNSHGVSIFFPDLKSEWPLIVSDAYSKLDFSTLFWDDFIKEYLLETYSIVLVGSRTIDGSLFEGLSVIVDDNTYKTSFYLDVLKGEHSFTSPSLWMNWSNLQVFLFDHWEDGEGKIMSNVKFTYDIQQDKIFRAVFRPLVSGTTIISKEFQGKLYLHVYDEEGHHVGLNYGQNQTEIGISGAYYYDDLNGTTIVLLPAEIFAFKVIIDSAFAEEPVENYTLAIIRTVDSHNVNQKTLQLIIPKNTSQEYSVKILSDGKVEVTKILRSQGWQIYSNLYVITASLVVVISMLTYVFMKRRKVRKKECV